MNKTKLRGFLSPLLKKWRLKKIAKFIKPNSAILDAGCDDASLLNLIDSFKYYTGIDFNKEVIKHNKIRYKGYKNVEFFQKNLNKKLILKKKYDFVVLSALIEHLNNFNKLMENLKEVTNDGSLILITTPTDRSDKILRFGSRLGMFSKESLEEHSRYFSKKDFTNLPGWKLKLFSKFELGLNQLIVLRKND